MNFGDYMTVTHVQDALQNTDGVTSVAISKHDDYHTFEARFADGLSAADEERVRGRFEAYGPTIETGKRNDGVEYVSLKISGLIDNRKADQ